MKGISVFIGYIRESPADVSDDVDTIVFAQNFSQSQNCIFYLQEWWCWSSSAKISKRPWRVSTKWASCGSLGNYLSYGISGASCNQQVAKNGIITSQISKSPYRLLSNFNLRVQKQLDKDVYRAVVNQHLDVRIFSTGNIRDTPCCLKLQPRQTIILKATHKFRNQVVINHALDRWVFFKREQSPKSARPNKPQ